MSAKWDDILATAKKRFKACQEWESRARALYQLDIRFANADADNGYQWPEDIQGTRLKSKQPSLTINKTRQHNLQIINDARQNKAQIRVRPVGDESTFEAAQVFEDVVRHIEYISNAEAAYDSATVTQVQGGIGYWRLQTEYKSDKSMDQEIFIRRIKDPMTVYLDPDIREMDGSDARYGFIFKDMPKEQFDAEYPDLKGEGGTTALDNNDGWLTKDHVRIAEYYCRSEKKDQLIVDKDGNVSKRSVIGKELADALKEDPETRTRDIVSHQIDCYMIVGDKITEATPWAGKYIPIFRVIGEETVIDGIMDRKGHTRALKDPQRMYNYWISAATAQIALQVQTPWVAPAEAIEGLEEYWRTANTVPHSVLPYKSFRDDGSTPIAKPERIEPPVMAQAFMSGLQVSEQQMQMVSGQYDSQMGKASNERTGVAIQERQRQGDNATYHYIDNLARAIRFTGRAVIDLIPKIYDTKRVVQIMAENGDRSTITIDPNAPKPTHTMPQADPNAPDAQAQIIFNPTIGEYDVEADVGPAFATRRQEEFNALLQIMTQSKEAMMIGADLLFKAADFSSADDLSERFKRMVPAQALGGPSPELSQANAQIQKMTQLLSQTMTELSAEKAKRTGQEQQKGIDVYKAETDRLALVKDIDPAILLLIGRHTAAEALSNPLAPIDQSIDAQIAASATPPPPQQPQQQAAQ